MEKLRIALTKGRLEKDTTKLLQNCGFDCTPLINKGRKLIIEIPESNIEIILAKAPDVITYIEHGACDIGIVGKDTIMESAMNFYEMLDLGFGKCRFALAGPSGKKFFEGYENKTIATKYPAVTRNYFNQKGMDVKIIKIEGSVELAPLLPIADAIVDIVETGSTLKENNLEIYEYIYNISARLIVNSASLKMKKKEIDDFLSIVKKKLQEN